MNLNKLKSLYKKHKMELVIRNISEFGKLESGSHTIGIHSIPENIADAYETLDRALSDNFPRVFVYVTNGQKTKEKAC